MNRCVLIGLTAFAVVLAGCGNDEAGSGDTGSAASAASSVASGTAQDERIARLWSELDALEHRRQLVQDSNDIKRLQRAYGYYLDHALWDDIADLFADEASVEIGLDGVYVGRDRIRDYFYALGDGESGLREGQLNEHLQLMPVVTVAPDGMTARGRWRDIILAGQLGEYAVWGEGPFENEYVKEDGVWKISSLHWFQTMLVDFEGGWHQNVDYNGGIWVSDELPPDEPTSWPYEPWPNTFLPPFHFGNPVLGAESIDLGAFAAETARDDTGLTALGSALAVLGLRVGQIEDENEIENLQRIYGFYVEEGLWSEAADLFADDGVFEIAGDGVYRGRDSIRAYFQSLGDEGVQVGRLYDRMQLMPIVHVDAGIGTARARWRLFAQEASYGNFAEWGSGWYENDYVEEDGVWKIAHLRLYNRMYTPDDQGWGQTALAESSYQARAALPDAPSAIEHAPYPAVPSPDFHYEHPVRQGASMTDARETSAGELTESAAADWMAELADRVERIEDIEQIERLQGIYGYYLARYEMDDLAGIFSDDGSIEIALRGVYAGKASVRRNLDLYPPVDLHNHMQYQPVIHLNESGDAANMRSRALSIMGSYDQYSMWMGGIYENEFVEEDGIWKLSKDQVFNTYFVNYGDGWKNNPPRPPPGISQDNPPDSPPTQIFEMYPSAFLPPYHYPNPVTGNPAGMDAILVSWESPQD